MIRDEYHFPAPVPNIVAVAVAVSAWPFSVVMGCRKPRFCLRAVQMQRPPFLLPPLPQTRQYETFLPGYLVAPILAHLDFLKRIKM